MDHILPGSQDAYYGHTKIEELRGKPAGIEFFPQREVFHRRSWERSKSWTR
ncbi:MAG: hypothetical protein ACE5GD_07540 [Candidatus Geothermarchaeales archaeon]